ncbi:MAG: tRNA-dihydrouridine synthase family protein [Syntrophorhabdaceae bacterium]|nr:tRNA-dihydrouridine synthase family protein [Syntrophorhabdaceae bacterium]
MSRSTHSIRVRGLEIHPPLLQAPMAGLTHSALRQIVSGFGGVGLLSTEMLLAKRLPTENPGMSPYLVRTAEERPLSYQLLVSGDMDLAPAMDKLHDLQADVIDLNMGCPDWSVGRSGAGFALMENPENARRLVGAARKGTELPLTAKIRLGVELDEPRLKDFCAMLEGEGIDMLSIHARLKKEPFARRPKWEWVARVKEWLGIPVIANGGIFTVEDARDCLRASGADGLMLGRGAVVRPWLFAEIARDVYGCGIARPSVSLPLIYGRFMDLIKELFPAERQLGRLKEFTHHFAGNYKFGHQLSSRIQGSRSMTQAHERAAAFFEENTEDPRARRMSTNELRGAGARGICQT